MRSTAYVALALVSFVMAATSLGSLCLRWAGDRKWSWPERLGLGFFLGSGVAAWFIFGLAAAGLARKGYFLVLATLAIAVGFRFVCEMIGALRDVEWPLNAGKLVIFGSLSAFFGVYVLYAWGPETTADAMDYHLMLPELYRRSHRFIPVFDTYQAGFPAAMEMMYLYLISIAPYPSCALLHTLFLFFMLPLFSSFGQLVGKPAAGASAAALFVMAPLIGFNAATAYVDVALAGFGLAATYATALWTLNDRRPLGLVAVAGALSGMAFSVKYTGVAVLLTCMAVILLHRPTVRSWPRIFGWLLGAWSIFALPWLVKNAVFYGNPFFPLLNDWFPNPYLHPSWEAAYTAAMRTFNGTTWSQIPWAVTVGGERLTGFAGPLFLLAPMGLFAMRHPIGRQLWVGIAVWIAFYLAGNIGARFLIPLLPLLSLAMASALPVRGWVTPAFVLMHALLCWPQNVTLYCDRHAYRMEGVNIARAWTHASPNEFLRRDPGWVLAQFVENATQPDAMVLSFSAPHKAYTTRRIIGPHQSAVADVALDILARAASAEASQNRVVCRISPPATRAVIEPGSAMAVTEIVAERAGKPVPLHALATPNPWYGRYLTDQNPFTAWAAWGRSAPARLALEMETAADRLAISSDGSLPVRAWDGQGVASTMNCHDETHPVQGLRSGALSALREMGITHVLFSPEDTYARHFTAPIQRDARRVATAPAGDILYALVP